VRANKLAECYLRPIAFYGSEKMGVSPKGATVHVAIAAWPWGAYLGAEALEKGIRVKTSSFARHHVNVSMCRAKYSGTYANSILASQEALDNGYDEGLLLDVDGFVAEGAGENLFLVKKGCIYEPELTSALMGITRDSVIALAADLGYTVTPRRVTRDDLYIADEAFFTGTAAEVTPIREVDGRKIGAGHRGPVTRKLQKAFFEVVNGRDQRHLGWLAPVALGKPDSAGGRPRSAAGRPNLSAGKSMSAAGRAKSARVVAGKTNAATGKSSAAARTPANKGKS
jgi:branched-chain amino acid aminotransferase